jgi:predicted AAA+ superfamily ATPase
VKNNFKSLLEIDTEAALSGNTPMLIDEWQTVPKLWDAVRYTVDHRRKMGQFILTDHSRTIFVPQSYHVRMMGSQRTTVNRL